MTSQRRCDGESSQSTKLYVNIRPKCDCCCIYVYTLNYMYSYCSLLYLLTIQTYAMTLNTFPGAKNFPLHSFHRCFHASFVSIIMSPSSSKCGRTWICAAWHPDSFVCACASFVRTYLHKWQEIRWESTQGSCVSFTPSINKDELRTGEGNGLSEWLKSGGGGLLWRQVGYEAFSHSYRNAWLAWWGQDSLINRPRMTFCSSMMTVLMPLQRKCPVCENGWAVAGVVYGTGVTNSTGCISLSIACQWYSPWQLWFSLSGIPVGRKWS